MELEWTRSAPEGPWRTDAEGRKVSIELEGGDIGNYAHRLRVESEPHHAATLAHVLIDAIDADETADLAPADADLKDLVAQAASLSAYRRKPRGGLDGCLIVAVVVGAAVAALLVIGIVAVVDWVR